MSNKRDAKFTVDLARRFPYSGLKIKDCYHLAALSVLKDLSDRRGIKWGLEAVDASTRREIVRALTAVIKHAITTYPQEAAP